MARAQHESLRPVSDAEQQALVAVVKATSERVDRVRRARALLVVAATGSFTAAAREAGFRSVTAVTNLVQRFNQRGVEALTITAGRGRRPTYDPMARAQIVHVAQTPPDRREDQTATWSLATLQRRLRREGLRSVGTSTVRRVLQEAGSSYQRTRTWCPTGTAQRVRKGGVVTVIDPETEEKRDDRVRLSVGRSVRDSRLVPRRSRTLSSDPAPGCGLVSPRVSRSPTARISARGYRETPHPVPSGDG